MTTASVEDAALPEIELPEGVFVNLELAGME
jgi:hypothetical protein